MGLKKIFSFALGSFLTLLILFGCAQGPAPRPMHPVLNVLPGELFDLAPGSNEARLRVVSVRDFAQRARAARYILVGEGHGSACDHNVQADIIRALAEAGANPVIGLEMVAVDKQDVLDRFNAGDVALCDLKKALDWSGNWGHFYKLYEPIFKLARELNLPLLALNVPKNVINSIRQGGLASVKPEDRPYLPSEVLPPSPGLRETLLKELERHQKMRQAHMERDANATAKDKIAFAMDEFLLIQSLWDNKMAESAVRAYEKYKRPVVILAGSGHVEYGWGIADRLKTFDPAGKALSVVPWRGEGKLDSSISDVFFYCPRGHKSRLGFSLEFLEQGAVVTGVEQDSKAFAAGIRENDIVLTAQGLPVRDLWVLHKAAVRAKKTNRPLEITVLRQGQKVTLMIEMSNPGEHAGEDVDAGTP